MITYTASDGSLQSPGTLTVTVGADDFPPIVSGPTVAFGKGKVDDTAPLRISWNAIDNGAGVQGFKAQATHRRRQVEDDLRGQGDERHQGLPVR